MKLHTIKIVAGLVLGVAVVGLAGVRETKHNFTSPTYSPNAFFYGTSQVCVFCHTTHNGDQTTGALWNHETNPPLYDIYQSPTLDMSIDQPHEGSLVCLSCHDGTIAINSLNNLPGPAGAGTYGTRGGAGLDAQGRLSSSSHAFVDIDLTNDHPVGVTYDASQDPTGFYAVTGVSTSYPDRLLDDGLYVECVSCHNPHDNSYSNFLIESNENSNLCLRCHIK